MTDRATALTYGVLIAFAVSIVLLVLDGPSGANLLLSLSALRLLYGHLLLRRTGDRGWAATIEVGGNR